MSSRAVLQLIVGLEVAAASGFVGSPQQLRAGAPQDSQLQQE
jgi:hypothetical protein